MNILPDAKFWPLPQKQIQSRYRAQPLSH